MYATTVSLFRLSALMLGALLLMTGATPLLGAPQAVTVDDVRQWNTALLRLQDRLPAGVSAARAPAIQQQAAALLVRRSRALATLVRTDPDQALAAALHADVLERLRQAFPASAAELEVRGSWEGILDYTIIDDEQLRQREVEIALQKGSKRIALHFAEREPAGLKSGVFLRVEGVRVGDEVAVEPSASAEFEESIHAASAQNPAEAAGACSALGDQRIAVIRATFPGVTPSLSRQKVVDTFFGQSGSSLDSYWKEASYNQTWATGDVYPLDGGWYELDREYSCASGNDESSLLRAKAIELADPDIDYSQYERVVIVFPKPSSGCRYAGLASLGCGMSVPDTTKLVSYAHQLSNYMGNSTQALQLTCHESGHSLGLSHAGSRRFYAGDGSRETLGAFGTSGTISTYGDRFSCLGSWVIGHYAASHKAKMGWLGGSALANVTSTGQFNVAPTEAPGAGTKALKIKRGTGGNDFVWVEYRQPIGSYDSNFSSQVYSGAMLHYEDPFTGKKSHLLDGTPATSSFSDPAVPSGSTTVDAYTNLSIAVGPASSSAVTVTVDFGPEPCNEADPTVSATPSNPSVDASSSVDYTVSVTNNDSSGCASAPLSLSSLEPAGWVSEFATSVLTLAPGATATVILTETVDGASEPGTYPIDVTATHETASSPMSHTDNVSATVTVVPDPCVEAAPTVTASPSDQSVDPGASATYNVTVVNNDSATCGEVAFSLSSNEPSGWGNSFSPSSLTLVPGASGTATLTETPGADAQAGAYPIGIAATHTVAGLIGDYGVTLTVNSLPDPCVEAAPTVTASPSDQSVDPGASTTYNVTVVNNDSATCGEVAFSLSSNEPAGWGNSFSPSSLTLAPGASGTATLTETPGADAQAGAYPIGIAATHTVAGLIGDHGVTLTVNSLPDPCVEAAPTVTASPSNQSVDPGASATYNVTVVNNDSATCGEAAFSLSSNEPAGWGSLFSPSSLTLAPGASGTATLTETPGADAQAGAYPIGISATHTAAGLIGNHGVTLTVNSLPEPCVEAAPTVTASPSNQSVDPGSSATYTVTVVNNDSATCGEVAFSLSSNEPSGWGNSFSPSSLTLAPGASGTATLTETPGADAAAGAYPIGILATHNVAGLVGDYGVTLTVNSLPDPCVEAAPTVTASPSNQSVDPGSSAAYSVTVVNNDSATCGEAAFSLSSNEPSGWGNSFSPSSLTLAAGASGTATLTETPGSDAAAGSYPIGIVATHTAAGLVDDYGVTLTVNAVTQSHTLTVKITGNGKVTSGDGTVNCTKDCASEYEEGAQVQLTATATKRNMAFARWEGACAGTSPVCSVTMDSDVSVTAVFERPPRGRKK